MYREAALANGTVVPFSSTAALVYGTVVSVSISKEMVSISGEPGTISMNLVHGTTVPVHGTVILNGDFMDYDGKKQEIGIFFCHMNDCNPLLREYFWEEFAWILKSQYLQVSKNNVGLLAQFCEYCFCTHQGYFPHCVGLNFFNHQSFLLAIASSSSKQFWHWSAHVIAVSEIMLYRQ